MPAPTVHESRSGGSSPKSGEGVLHLAVMAPNLQTIDACASIFTLPVFTVPVVVTCAAVGLPGATSRAEAFAVRDDSNGSRYSRRLIGLTSATAIAISASLR